MTNQEGNDDAQKIADEELNKDIQPLEVDPVSATPEQVEELSKANKTLLVQKKRWRELAIDPKTGKRWVDIAKEQAPKPPANDVKPATLDDEYKTKIDKLEMVEEKRQFGHSHGLSPEETDFIFAQAKGTGQKPDDTLNSPIVKNAIEALRKEQRQNNARPGASHKAPTVGGKTFQEMKPDERKANWAKITGAEK